MLAPGNFLTKFLSASQPPDLSTTYNVWSCVADMDVVGASDESVPNIAAYWARLMSLIHFYAATKPVVLAESVVCQVVRCADIALKLYLRLNKMNRPATEPIAAFLGVSTEVSNDIQLESPFVCRTDGISEIPDSVIQFLTSASVFTRGVTMKIDKMCKLALTLAIFEARTAVTSELFDFVEPLQKCCGCLTDEEILAAKGDGKLGEGVVWRENVTDEFMKEAALVIGAMRLVVGMECLERTQFDERSFEDVMPKWMMASRRIDYDFEMNEMMFVMFCMLGKINVSKIDMNGLSEKMDARMILFYGLYVNITTPYLEEFDKHEIGWLKGKIRRLREELNLVLVTRDKGDVESCKILLAQKACLDQLTDSRLHRIVRALLTEVDVVDETTFSIDVVGSAMLFNAVTKKNEADPLLVSGILKRVLEKLKEITKPEDENCIFCDTVPFGGGYEDALSQAPLPYKNTDFLTEEPIPIGVVCAWMTHLCMAWCVPSDEETVSVLVDISLCWYANGANNGRLVNVLKNVISSLESLRMKAQNMRHVVVLQNPETRRQCLMSLDRNIMVKYDVMIVVLGMLVKEFDTECLQLLYKQYQDEVLTVAVQLDYTAQITILEMLLPLCETKSNISLAGALLSQHSEELFALLGRKALDYPLSVLPLFGGKGYAAPEIKAFIENLPEFPMFIHRDFVHVIDALLVPLAITFHSDYNIARSTCIHTEWDESKGECDRPCTNEVNLWQRTQDSKLCNKRYGEDVSGFRCYTCASEDGCVCEICANKCHYEHDIVYVGPVSGRCVCGAKCIASNEEVNAEAKVGAGEEQKVPLDVMNNLLVSLFERLLACSLNEPTKVVFTSRLSTVMRDWMVQGLPTVIEKPKIVLRSRPGGKKLVDATEFVRCLNQGNSAGHIGAHSVCSPLELACIAGPEKDFLVISSGNKMTAYSVETGEPVAMFETETCGVQLCTCPYDPSVFAHVSLQALTIFVICASGFELVYEVSLMLDTIDSNALVLSVAWVPMELLHIAVICNRFVKIYDLTVDRVSPFSCYLIEDGDSVTSCVFTTLEDDVYALVALESGKIAIERTSEKDGPVTLSTFASIDGLPRAMVISVDTEGDLLFITGPGCDLYACRLSNVLAPVQGIAMCRIKLGSTYAGPFVCIFHTSSHFFFLSPSTHQMIMVEFTDKSFVLYPFDNTTLLDTETFSLSEKESAILSFIVIDNELVIISAVTGKLMRFKHGGNDVGGNNDSNIVAPANFWTQSRPTTNDISVSHCDRRRNQYTFGSRFIFDNSSQPKELRLKSTDPKQCIVGLKVTVGAGGPTHRPPWLKINGRKAVVSESRSYMLPLFLEEVCSGDDVRLEFGSNGGLDINCDDILVFVLDKDKLPTKCGNSQPYDWLTDANNVFEWTIDEDRDELCDVRKCIPWLISDTSADVDENTLERLIRVIYTHPSGSQNARSMVCALVHDRDAAILVWSRVLKSVIVERKIHRDLWTLVWRDIALLPVDMQADIGTCIWENDPVVGGPFSVVAAFFSR